MAEMASDETVFADLVNVFTLLIPDGIENRTIAVAQRKLQTRIIEALTGKLKPQANTIIRVKGEYLNLQ